MATQHAANNPRSNMAVLDNVWLNVDDVTLAWVRKFQKTICPTPPSLPPGGAYNEDKSMCTVSIIPLPNGIRLACNRDESRLRPVALPPRIVTADSRRAIMPIDPQSGGTWIAVNNAGLVMALLNSYPSQIAARPSLDPDPPRRSRGHIIPEMIAAKNLQEACDLALKIQPADFAPFRLLIADRTHCADFQSNGQLPIDRTVQEINRPLFFTSSGLGDTLVGEPRGRLFAEFFPNGSATEIAQDAFHRHSWPERPHLSVWMSRPDACTVSLTVAELTGERVGVAYYSALFETPSSHIMLTQ